MGDITDLQIEEILRAIHDYIGEMPNDDCYMAAHKIKQSIFYIENQRLKE